MASIKFGGGITDIRGKMGGNVYSKNRFGAYMRKNTVPVNPRTALQNAVRAAFSQLSVRWSQTLTALQRTGWNSYGANVAVKNRLGEDVFLTGVNHYQRSNVILAQIGEAYIDAAPAIFELPEQDPTLLFTASEAAQELEVAFDDTLEWLDEDGGFLVVYMGNPQNPTVNFFDGPWRLAGFSAGDSVTPPTTPETVTCPFAITETQKIFIYARIVRADGRVSEKFRADAFCAA